MLCDQIMDVYGNQAIVCSSCGDRNYRHNPLRNTAFNFEIKEDLKPT